MGTKKGFTLVEVLIATVIMVSVLGALVYGLGQCSNLAETARNQDTALSAAQFKLEQIANDISNIITTYNNQTFAIEGLTGPADDDHPGSVLDPGEVDVVTIVDGQLYDVSVTVTWQQRAGRQLSRTLTTSLRRR